MPKILLFDIETAPNLSYIWAQYEQNALSHVQESYMLSFAYKWLGDKKVTVKSLREYKGYKPSSSCDKALVTDLWQLLDEADIVIGHNVDSFDIKKSNTRFIQYGFDPPQFYRTVDTLKLAKRHFKFNSNKLDDLGNFLGVGRKVKHTGFSLWLGCLAGNESAWSTMERYNKQDVNLLEKVYLKLLPWSANHPNLNVLMNRTDGCGKCGSTRVQKRGFAYTNFSKAQRYQCKDCGGYTQGKFERAH